MKHKRKITVEQLKYARWVAQQNINEIINGDPTSEIRPVGTLHNVVERADKVCHCGAVIDGALVVKYNRGADGNECTMCR